MKKYTILYFITEYNYFGETTRIEQLDTDNYKDIEYLQQVLNEEDIFDIIENF